jgi:hypothetical protein
MRFVRSFGFGLSLVTIAVLAMSLAGCGGGSNGGNTTIQAGNWALSATSATNNSGAPSSIGGNLTQSGQVVSGTVHIVGSTCFDSAEAIPVSGSINGSNLVLQVNSTSGQQVTLAATVTSTSINGTYTVAGGCANGDAGTVAGNPVPSISGTWSGPVAGSGGTNVTLSIALTQATTASADGSFALTGTVTYMNSSCSTSGTITSGSIAGTSISELDVQTVESDASQGSFTYSNVSLNSSTAPTSMSGDYSVDSGLCSSDAQTLTLTKQ